MWTSNSVDTLKTYFHSEEIAHVQQQLIEDQVPRQCIKCYDQEQRSGHSFRTLNQKFENSEQKIRDQSTVFPRFEIKDISIVTSNICNLKCLPCEGASYIRDVELHKLKIKNTFPLLVTYDNEYNLQSFESLKKITFLGGEPFADKITFELIDQLIESGQSRNIRLDLNTNLTLCTRENLLKIRDNFDEVIIKGSIDGVERFNEYLRYPSEWSEIERAIGLIQELKIPMIITTALSNLALLRYADLVHWAMRQGIDDLFLSKVTEPQVLAFDHLPSIIKLQLLEEFKILRTQYQFTNRTDYVIDTCIEICSNTNMDHDISDLTGWLSKHDEFRGTDFRKIWPELNNFC
jgi:MoaA/NifB/PqqE/SkfB family radical SAM enzyme